MKKLRRFLWTVNVLAFVLVLVITVGTVRTSAYFSCDYKRIITDDKDYSKVAFGMSRIRMITGSGGLQIVWYPEKTQRAFTDVDKQKIFIGFGWHKQEYPNETQISSAAPRVEDGGLWQVSVTGPEVVGFQYARCTIIGVQPDGTREPPFVQWRSVTFPHSFFLLVWAIILFRSAHKRWILWKMKQRGDVLCPHCTYDIASITKDKPCPECGKHAETTKTA